MSTLYLIVKPTSLRLPRMELLAWFTIVGLFFSTLFFALGTLHSKDPEVNTAFFRVPSIALFAFSVAGALYAVVQDHLRVEADPLAQAASEQKELVDEFLDTKPAGGESN